MSKFKLKDGDGKEVEIVREQVEEIIPDADFRFSLVTLKTDEKFFVFGTKNEIELALEK